MAYTPAYALTSVPTTAYTPVLMEETSTAVTYRLGSSVDFTDITEDTLTNDIYINRYITPALTTSLKYTNDNYIKWSTWADYSLVSGPSNRVAVTDPGTVTWCGNYIWVSNGIYGGFVQEEELSKKALFVGKLKANLVIAVKTRSQEIPLSHPAEKIALETLREVISEAEFRKYLRYGFILVKGQSGDIFQIFRNRSHTKVWRNGKVIEEVCVRIREVNVPPTDNVIAFRQIIQTSEIEFKKLGNVYKMAA